MKQVIEKLRQNRLTRYFLSCFRLKISSEQWWHGREERHIPGEPPAANKG